MESGSHKKLVSESSSRSPTVMRKRASSSLAAYLIAREQIQTKIREVAEEELGPGGMTRFVAGLLSLGKSRSMEDMIDDSARAIFQEYSRTLPPGLFEEEDVEIEEVEHFRGTALRDEISRLIVQLLRILPDEDLLSRQMSWTSMSDTISSYIGMEGKEIEGEVVLSDPLVTVTNEGSSEKKHEESEEKQEKERSLEEKEIEGQAVLAEGRLATVTTGRALEGKEIEGDAVISKDKPVEEGDALISKDKAEEMEETFARVRDFVFEPWSKEFEEEAFEEEAAVAKGSLGTVTTDRGLEEKEFDGEAFEGEAAVAGGSLGTVTTDRGLEGKETEGEAVISKDKAAEIEEEAFALFRRGWEHVNGANNFEDLTLFSPMLFTHSTPGFKPIDAVLARTVQICSIKVTDVEHFKWPLHVYGVVAARDAVDSHRNPIFLRPRDDCQIIYDVDPFLHLTGPVRAIVSEERVDIEIQLIVKGTTASEDRALISYPFLYDGDYLDGSGISIIEKNFCTLEMCYQQLESSVQATIFGVHADDGKSLPFQYGVRVACTSLSQCGNEEANESASTEVVLFDWKVGRKCAVKLGYLDLSRQVVSVELDGKLKVHIETYASSGDIAAQGDVFVIPKECNTSEHTCDLGSFKVNFTVAWSLLVEDEEHILMNGCIDPLAFCPPIGPSTMSS